MHTYKVSKYTSEYKKQWDDFVDQAKNATFLFKRDFMEYHSDRFEDYSLLVFDQKNNLKAIVPANITGDTLHSHQGLTYGGIVTKSKIKFTDLCQLTYSILFFLKENKIERILLKKAPSIYFSETTEETAILFNFLEAKKIKQEVSLSVDLKNRIGFTASKRQSISNSKKHGLNIVETNSFSDYWNSVLIPNLQKKYNEKPVHNLDEISLLNKRFPKNIKQFNVYNNKQIIAGVTIFETENVAHSQYSSGIKEFNALRGLDFLLDYLINDKYKDKNYFSFGTSTANESLQINESLFSWKQSFGANVIPQETFSIETQNLEKLKTIFV